MKRSILCLILIIAGLSPLAAGAHLINMGLSSDVDFSPNHLTVQNAAIIYTLNTGSTFGFHTQITPFMAFGYTYDWDTPPGDYIKLADVNVIGGGINAIIGVGGDINFGNFGLIVGGGLYTSLYGHMNYSGSMTYFKLGLGIGADLALYYQFKKDGPFLINFGVSTAWVPFEFDGNNIDIPYDSEWSSTDFNFKFHLGIGFRI